MAAAIEATTSPSQEERLKHRSFVISSVLSAVSFVEACSNELYAICAEHPDDVHVKGHAQDARFQNIGDTAIVQIGALWNVEAFQRNAKPLEKYQTALCLSGKPLFPLGQNPYQDAQLVIQLRNLLVHFKPEQREVALGSGNSLPPDEFQRKYQGKFPINPLTPKFFGIGGPNGPTEADYPFFPREVFGLRLRQVGVLMHAELCR